MANFHFDPINRIITVLAPDTEITVQELINAIRDWEDDHLEWDKVADATGKDYLGAGLYTAITVRLLNWRLKFQDRDQPTACIVRGGNLLAVDEYGNYMYPIAPATDVTVTISQSTAASLLAEWKQTDIDLVKTQVGYIPSDLPEVPTMAELNAAHGSGSWEGATPTQIWQYSVRSLTTRNVNGEQIASEGTLNEIKGVTFDTTRDSLKKIREALEERVIIPKSIAQYLETLRG
jgi:hypothetical protein